MGYIRIIEMYGISTIQDLGRFGYQNSGVPVSGAMDKISMRIANRLVGNGDEEAVLEIALYGGTYSFECDAVIALAGADFNFKLNGKQVPRYQTIFVNRGDILSGSSSNWGNYAYLSFRGGLKLEDVLNSKSTYMRGSFGGYYGRRLKQGDLLTLNVETLEFPPLKISTSIIEKLYQKRDIRFNPSHAYSQMMAKGLETFKTTEFLISGDSDRMGLRLEGKVPELMSQYDIISAPVQFGSIQINSSGQPMILMADAQTTGGYVLLGTVFEVDLSYLVQLAKGEKLKFMTSNVEESIVALMKLKLELEDCLKPIFNEKIEIKDSSHLRKRLRIGINGKAYNVSVLERKV